MSDEPKFLGVIGWISLLLIPPEMGTILWMYAVVVPSIAGMFNDFGASLPHPTVFLLTQRTAWVLVGESIPIAGLFFTFFTTLRPGVRDTMLAITAFAGLLYILLAWVALYLPIFTLASSIR